MTPSKPRPSQYPCQQLRLDGEVKHSLKLGLKDL